MKLRHFCLNKNAIPFKFKNAEKSHFFDSIIKILSRRTGILEEIFRILVNLTDESTFITILSIWISSISRYQLPELRISKYFSLSREKISSSELSWNNSSFQIDLFRKNRTYSTRTVRFVLEISKSMFSCSNWLLQLKAPVGTDFG